MLPELAPLDFSTRLTMLPSRLLYTLCLLTFIATCLVRSLRADTSTTDSTASSSLLANLTSVNLVANTDRVTYLAMGDIVLAYRLVSTTTSIQTTVGSLPINLAALQADSIDFATSAATTHTRPTHYVRRQ